jgi:hypothetical protein
MEDLRQINDINYEPSKGDNVVLDSRYGVLLDENFNQILWTDNEEVEDCIGGWSAFLEAGGYILVI